MRQWKGRRHGRGGVPAVLITVLAALVLATALLVAAPVMSRTAYRAGPAGAGGPGGPAPHPVASSEPARLAAPFTVSAGRVARHYFPPLELVASPPDHGGADAGATALVSGALAAAGPAGTDAGDGSFWPDSSSPVRNPPSNATTGPARPAVPAFPGWDITKVNLTDGTRQRYYLVAHPTVITSNRLPVLLVLPGRNMTAATIARASGFLKLVGQAVVVFPAGFANSWNAGYCCGVAHLAGVNDVAFLETVVHRVLADEPGTSARSVYIAGFSNGGRMALDMACADPGAFAGVAAVEAVAVSSCARTVPVPVLEVASTADPLLTVLASAPPKHIAGHVEVTVQALVDRWRALDGCRPVTERTDYRALTITEWGGCRGTARVAMAVYDGGRHAWPHGGPGNPSAQAVIWDFFHGSVPPVPPGGPAAA